MLKAKIASAFLSMLTAVCALGSSASAQAVRLNNQDGWSLVCDLPRGWSAEAEPNGEMLLIGPPASHPITRRPRGAVVTLSFRADDQPLDEVADTLSVTIYNHVPKLGAISVSGYPGFRYRHLVSGDDQDLVLVRIDPQHVAVIAALIRSELTPAEADSVKKLAASVTITSPSDPPWP